MENPNACANCNPRLITEADKSRAADSLLLLMCDRCLSRRGEFRRERAPRAAQWHTLILGMIAGGLTLADVRNSPRRGVDLFGVCAMTGAEYHDFLLCIEQARGLSPAGSEERLIVGATAPAADSLLTKHRRQQRAAHPQPRRVSPGTLPRGGRVNAMRRANAALDADLEYLQAA